jgi:anti-sigma regulatory factor (Ser/Thr protein kinase)
MGTKGSRTTWSHEANFDATPTSAAQARAFVSYHLVDHRLLYLVESVRLVTSELATNALVHAQTAFSLSLSASDTEVVLTVRDGSHALPERRAAQVLDATGRGLEIVEMVSREWGINQDEAGSKGVWASFAIRNTGEF